MGLRINGQRLAADAQRVKAAGHVAVQGGRDGLAGGQGHERAVVAVRVVIGRGDAGGERQGQQRRQDGRATKSISTCVHERFTSVGG